MKDGFFQIGEVSRITGISKDTLHFYDRMGLVTPDYTDPHNKYRYYSRWNMWQLDIVSACRKLSVPLARVKRLMACHDNEKIVALLSEYREEALRLSSYYQQVASDIDWYEDENQKIRACREEAAAHVEQKYLPSELVIMGREPKDGRGYHAHLQEAAREILPHSASIQRKYGYVLAAEGLTAGDFIKQREYLKLNPLDKSKIPTDALYELPEGEYAVFIAHIQGDQTDFRPLLAWLKEHARETDLILAEELGLQLFDYIPDYYCEVKAHLRA